MDTPPTEPGHEAAVDGWIDRSFDAQGSSQPSSVQIVRLFHEALEAVWNRAVTTLGSVTLTAIAERVLVTATEHHGFLSAINPRPNGDTRWRHQLHERLATVPRQQLIVGLRFGLIELFRVIGTLTAEILTPELHAALAGVVVSTTESSASAPHAAISIVGNKAQS
jgi:hypothetical protein